MFKLVGSPTETMTAVDIFDRGLQEAERRGAFEEAAGWARMKTLANPADLRSVANTGLMLTKAASLYRDSGDYRRAARAARQVRQTMDRFKYPSGIELVDNIVELSESIFAECCEHLGIPAPGFREEIDPNRVGEWINALDGFESRRLDWVRLADAASEGQ